MKYEVNKEVVNQAEFTITVDKETVAKAVNKGYLKIAKNVDIPGFRKGKVPKFVLVQKIGIEPILEEAAEIMMSPAYAEAVSEEGVEPIASPKVEIVKIAEDDEFVFKATCITRPEPKLGDYKGMKLTKKVITVGEEEINAEIERTLDQHSKMVAAPDGIVEEGDIVTINYKGTIDGEEFQGGSADNYPLGIGSDTFIPGFEEQLKGHKTDEDVDVKVTFPEDYHAEDLKGKDAVFACHICEIRKKELPELTDDFVKLISPAEDVDGFKKHIEEDLKDQADRSMKEGLKDQAIEKLLEMTEVEIPDLMVDEKLDSFVADMSARISQQGLDLQQYLDYIGKTMEELREENRPGAEKSVRTEVALLGVAKAENIEATDVDIDTEITKVALMTNSQPDDIKNRLLDNGQYSVLVFTIIMKKAIDFLVDNAEVTEEEAE